MGFDYIYETLESKFDKFKEYQNYLAKDVFGHNIEIQPGLNMLIVIDNVDKKSYRIVNDHFLDEDVISSEEYDDLYKDFVVKSNLFFAELYGYPYMEDTMKYFKNLRKANMEEIALGELNEDYWRYDEHCKAEDFYYDVIKELDNGFARIDAKNEEKEI